MCATAAAAAVLDEIRTFFSARFDLSDVEIDTDFSTKKGDGLVGDIHTVRLRGRSPTDGDAVEFNLVLKTAPTHEVFRRSMPVHRMYANEFYAYEKVLPSLRGVSPGSFVNHPTFYVKRDVEYGEFLVLGDLKADGYVMRDNKVEMDDEHVRAILRDLAKFHSASYLLKEFKPEEYEEVVDGLRANCAEFFKRCTMCDGVIDQAKELDGIFTSDEVAILERFRAFYRGELKKFMTETCYEPKDFFVVAHGDLWCNNLLFKYDDDRKLTSISMLDFQAVRYSSKCIDISYFFYVCANKRQMDGINGYLEYYYEETKKILAGFGLEIGFTFDDLLDEWKVYNKFGFTMALVVLHGVTSDSDEFPSVGDILDAGGDFWTALNFVSRNDREYKRKVKDLIVHFYEQDYI